MKAFDSLTLTIGATVLKVGDLILAEDATFDMSKRCYFQFFADTDNAGVVAVGGASADPTPGAQNGIPLSAGADEAFLGSASARDIYLKATTANQVVTVLYWMAP